MGYIKLNKATQLSGLSPNTLRKYAEEGLIPARRTPTGFWLFDESYWLESVPQSSIVLYARVSSVKQKDDLTRQIAFLRESYPDAEIVQDIASGLNFKRKGLTALLERSLGGDAITVVVAHRDRLARFGFDLLEYLFKRSGGGVVVLSSGTRASPEEELTADLLAILTVFAARSHGLRKYRDALKKDTNQTDSAAENDL